MTSFEWLRLACERKMLVGRRSLRDWFEGEDGCVGDEQKVSIWKVGPVMVCDVGTGRLGFRTEVGMGEGGNFEVGYLKDSSGVLGEFGFVRKWAVPRCRDERGRLERLDGVAPGEGRQVGPADGGGWAPQVVEIFGRKEMAQGLRAALPPRLDVAAGDRMERPLAAGWKTKLKVLL